MFKILKARLHQKHRTMAYPAGPPPELPARFVGRPVTSGECSAGCTACAASCPTGAVMKSPETRAVTIDTGSCLFCRRCEAACPKERIRFGKNYRLASTERTGLIIHPADTVPADVRSDIAAKYFTRSLKLRQVSAGGCNACEADSNVLETPVWDMGRIGIQFVASPRHADGLLITGPVTGNMRLALEKAYAAVSDPKIVIAVGACAVSGGPYRDHPEQNNGASAIVPVDLFIPGCPPHPLTILDGLLRFLGRV